MLATVSKSQAEFYREFVMGRRTFEPREFGVDLEHEAYADLMVDEFNLAFRGVWTIDELCLHPREALNFCDMVRRKHGYLEVPDHAILRPIMQRRKNP